MPVCSTVRRVTYFGASVIHAGITSSRRWSPCHQVYAVGTPSRSGNFSHTHLFSLHGVGDEVYNEGTHLMVCALHRMTFHGHSAVSGTLVRDTNRL